MSEDLGFILAIIAVGAVLFFIFIINPVKAFIKGYKEGPGKKPAPKKSSPLPVTKAPEKKKVPVRDRTSPVRKSGSNNIFVSYRRADSADVAGRIYDRLIAQFGQSEVFKDVDSIPLGVDFKEYLDKIVSSCTVLLVIIGGKWLEATNADGQKRLDDPRDFVRIELEAALTRNIPVIPLLVQGAAMPTEESLPPSLRKLIYRNGIPIRPDPDFHRDMDRLISAIESYIKG